MYERCTTLEEFKCTIYICWNTVLRFIAVLFAYKTYHFSLLPLRLFRKLFHEYLFMSSVLIFEYDNFVTSHLLCHINR